MNNQHTPQGGTMRYQVILDMRRNGASYGSTDDVIDADSPDAAEQSAIEQWKTLRPRDMFHPLLTLELRDDAPESLVDAETDNWVSNGGEPPDEITVHHFESTTDAYNASQCDDDIKDGDVLVVASEMVVGIMVSAWPTAITPQHGKFHQLADGLVWTTFEGGRYAKSYATAQRTPLLPQEGR